MPSQMTPTEAAKVLGVKIETLANWRAAGFGPAYTKVGRRVFYEPATVLAYRGLRAQRDRLNERLRRVGA